jgi:hypothetical protein
MASGPAQSQEDVAAAVGPAVGSRSLDHLPVDPRRPHAVARHGDQARPRPTRAARRRGHAAIPGTRRCWRDQPDRSRRVRTPRRRPPVRAAGPSDHGVLPGGADAPLRSRLPGRRFHGDRYDRRTQQRTIRAPDGCRRRWPADVDRSRRWPWPDRPGRRDSRQHRSIRHTRLRPDPRPLRENLRARPGSPSTVRVSGTANAGVWGAGVRISSVHQPSPRSPARG